MEHNSNNIDSINLQKRYGFKHIGRMEKSATTSWGYEAGPSKGPGPRFAGGR
jgi:hypothetical protein